MEKETPKLVFIIGEHIERANPVALMGLPLHVETFPECTPATSAVSPRLPLHSQAAVGALRAMLEQFKKDNSYSLGVVTHSSYLVNYAGKLVADRYLDCTQVEVWRYDGATPDLSHPSAVFKFNSMGFLEDWQYGWFEPDFDA